MTTPAVPPPDALRPCWNAMRLLVMDAIEKARSGHPGAAMALAPLAPTLYARYLRHNPANPRFANRDRFVLSAGHASMWLYAALHLSGYDLSLDDIRAFRQLGSRTPGHPEFGLTPGVETTTGPLGQGAATSVGLALGQKWLAARFNRPDHAICDYRIFALLGDGCMMEGLTAEAASLAGHLQLDNLLWFYDSNRITIEGPTGLAFSEDVVRRFAALGWFVQQVERIDDTATMHAAIDRALAHRGQPRLIVLRTKIAYGAPKKQGTAAAHGEPLGAEEIRGARQFFGCPQAEPFHVPAEVRTVWTEPVRRRGAEIEQAWNAAFSRYAQAYPELAAEWRLIQERRLPEGWESALPVFEPSAQGLATRASAAQALTRVSGRIPWLLGGAADLAPSTKTLLPDTTDFTAATPAGRNLRFGVREHAMAAAGNGLALSGLRPFVATFLVFSDYARPSIRLAAMMHQPVIYVFTHDSIGVGEDGPTHQPIEHLAALRSIPNLDVFRPADANEAALAWRHALANANRPVALVLSRQNLPTLDRTRYGSADGALRGGYVVADCSGIPEVIIVGTGSELHLAIAAHAVLAGEGRRVRVVSLPCQELFDRQPQSYRDTVLPPQVTARVAVEAGVSQGWHKYVGSGGALVTLDSFGASAPYEQVQKHCGLTADAVVAAARAQARTL